jgi:pseudaminic acid synthase
MKIANRNIGSHHPPYIICELSANHNGSFERAIQLVDAAIATGCDAIKIQTYRPDTITLNADTPDFRIEGGLWSGRTLYDLYSEAHMPWEWHKPLFDHARKRGATIFSSPFDTTAVDLLEDLGAAAYKVASCELIDIPLIRYIASTRKPMIISTGMGNTEEIAEAVEAARDAGCTEIALLHCVSGYPAPATDYNLATLQDMKSRFGTVVGLSDHTIDNTVAIASVALGSSIIEKHFTLDRRGGGPDDSFSLEPPEFTSLCIAAKNAWASIGRVNYELEGSEMGNVRFRRSIYFVKDMRAGEIITDTCIRSVRPGFGLPPKSFYELVGSKLRCDVSANTPTSWDVVERREP